MKKNKFTEFFKGKGYYVLLFVGVVAIAAVALIGSQLTSNQNTEDENYVDLNDTDNNIAADDEIDYQTADNTPSEGIVNNGDNLAQGGAPYDEAGQDLANNDSLLEFDVVTEDEVNGTDTAEVPEETEVAEEEPADAVETAGGSVEGNLKPTVETLSFNSDNGLQWPVNGNVLMNYSMDHTILFATLKQYKCNPAIIIDAEIGTEVKAAATGIVSSIDADNEETGYTITTEIGNGYSCVYGQLENVNLEVGDSINEGEVIGTIAKPTKYYSVEGSNLYFQVMENDQTINPMSLLK